jgi:microcin C transport system permease protein
MWQKFKKNKRGYYSLIIFSIIFVITLFAEIIANDKPLIVKYKDDYYFPLIKNYSEQHFGGQLKTYANYRDPVVKELINKEGWMLMPLIPFSYDTINFDLNGPAPTSPDKQNWLGSDDQGRDILARIIYGVRVSLIFGIILSFFSSIIGVFFGAIQGYFAGLLDLLFQRFMEIWSSMPTLFLLIILSSVIEPGFFSLLFLMLLFSWMSMVGFVRAEFLRLRNFDFVKSAKAIGANDYYIMWRHILPNASPIIMANLPFLIAGSITTLTALDFLGLGMPAGSASLGELLAQGKNNINSYWIAISGFIILTKILMLLVFIGEALRDALDSRK